MDQRRRDNRSFGKVNFLRFLYKNFSLILRYAVNLIVGILDGEQHKSFLVAVKFLEKTNHQTIARFVNDNLRELVAPEKVLLFVTDAASYMLKAADVGFQFKCLKKIK